MNCVRKHSIYIYDVSAPYPKTLWKAFKEGFLQCPHRDEKSADEADVTAFILVDMPDEKIEQYSESLSVICTDLLI